MLRARGVGLWQTPCQLASFLVRLARSDIRTYLELGPCTGWTTAFMTAYLTKFGLTRAVSLDAFNLLDPRITERCASLGLPLTFADRHSWPPSARTWDLVFIDADHSFDAVMADIREYAPVATRLALHDINDHFCQGVVRAWAWLKERYAVDATFDEFTDHPDGYELMGIGLVTFGPSRVRVDG
jgi:hypothetical protein